MAAPAGAGDGEAAATAARSIRALNESRTLVACGTTLPGGGNEVTIMSGSTSYTATKSSVSAIRPPAAPGLDAASSQRIRAGACSVGRIEPVVGHGEVLAQFVPLTGEGRLELHRCGSAGHVHAVIEARMNSMASSGFTSPIPVT
jgi:hypothetical protein